MPKCRVVEKSYINHALVEAGEIVEYDGIAGANLELVAPEPDVAPVKKGKAKGDAAPAEGEPATE